MTADPHWNQPIRSTGKPIEQAVAALVLLHGRGASAAEILTLGQELVGPEVAIVAPEAAGHTWYPYSFLAPVESNEPWLGSALRLVETSIQRLEGAGIIRRHIALAGFSQGACLASEWVARTATRLAALIAFTGGRIGPPGTTFDASGDLTGMPIYLSAGEPDPHVPWERMEATRDCFERMGAKVTLKCWPGRPHSILRQEVEDARNILAESLAATWRTD